MKIIILFVLSFFFFSVLNYSQNVKQIKVYLHNTQDIITLSSTGVDPEEGIISKDNTIKIFINNDQFVRLQKTNLDYDILIDDWYSYYNSLPVLTVQEKTSIIQKSKNDYNVDGFGFGSMGGFYTYAEIAANLDSMYLQFPNLITQKYSIGTTLEGRTIWAVKISDNPNITENEPSVGFDALIHAREPASMSSLMYFMWYLLQNYGSDPVATYLVNNRQIYCVPVMNPDGYEYNHQTNPNGGGDWRKNRKNSGGGCYGIDLNRNYSYMWGYDNIGSSPYPCDETYRGTAAFSELETQAIRDFVIGKNIQTYFNMHAYGNDLLYPWGYINQACPDEETYVDFCEDMVVGNGFVYGTGGYILGYNSNGAARDWLYGEQTIKNKIYGYTIEIGTGDDFFWPTQSRIFPIAENTLWTLIYNSYVAGEYLKLVNPNFSCEYFLPGFVSLAPEYTNKGLTTAYNVKVELSSPSQYINTKTFFVTIDSVEARSSITLFPSLSFLILDTTPAEEEIPLVLTTSINNEISSIDTVNIIIGMPEYVFHDTTDNPANLWTITATPANPHWEATTSSYYTPPTSYTDSKNGSYANNATVTMTLTNPIDLSQYSSPRLSFSTKYNLEPGYDYGQVEISSNNGGNWIPLEGNYTMPGSGTFQPPGEPLYNGTQTTWVSEEINLAQYVSNQVKVRFILKSDVGITADGWYVDDIGIKVYSAIPVELISFTAVPVNKMVELNWITSTETNNKGFEIQRSEYSGQKSYWKKIGFVEGFGTTSEEHTYFYTDNNPGAGQYLYRLKQIDYDGTFKLSQQVEVNITSPIRFALEQNYPNPFNPITKIKYSIPGISNVQMKVYDVLGEEVATLVNEKQQAGRYEIMFDGNNFATGIYLYRLTAGSYTETRKMILLK